MLALEHRAILGRQDFDELADIAVPVVEDALGRSAPGVLMVAHDERVDALYLLAVAERSQLDHPGVAAVVEAGVIVEHVGDSTAHPGGEVAPGAAQHDHRAARHVLAAMVADTLDDRRRAAVAHREALASHAPKLCPADPLR